MVPTPDFSAITDLFTNTVTLGTAWLIPIALTLILMAFVTKDVEKWKTLALPILVLQTVIGIPVHFLLLAGAGVLFVVETMSTQVVGRVFGFIKGQVKRPRERFIKEGKILDNFRTAEKHEARLNKLRPAGVAEVFGMRSNAYKRALKRSQSREYIEAKDKGVNISNAEWKELRKRLDRGY